MTFAELQAPFRIVERGRGGKYNRIRMVGDLHAVARAGGDDEGQLYLETMPSQLSDKLFDTFGGRSWSRRQANKAMRRLRSILEDGKGRGARATVEAG